MPEPKATAVRSAAPEGRFQLLFKSLLVYFSRAAGSLQKSRISAASGRLNSAGRRAPCVPVTVRELCGLRRISGGLEVP